LKIGKIERATKSEKLMLTLQGVGFYSYITAVVFGDTRKSVDEVISPRFLFVSIQALRTEPNINITNNFKTK